MNFNIHKNYEYFYLLFKLSSFICFIKVDDASGRLPTYVIYKQIKKHILEILFFINADASAH